jgi:hypothetical protein
LGEALMGGSEVGSRVRIAAAACLVASGLMVGGVGGALAFANPVVELDGTDAKPTNDELGDQIRDGLGEGDGEQTDPQKDPPGGATGEKPDGHKPGESTDGESNEGERRETKRGDNLGDEEPKEEPGVEEPGEEKPEEEPDEETTAPSSPPPEPPPPDEEELREENPNCNEKGDDDCGVPRPPWWPWPLPWDPNPPGPGEPPGPGGGGGGGGGGIEPPSGRPDVPPGMQVPPHVGVEPDNPAVLSAAPGLGVAAAELPLAPIALPLIVVPPIVVPPVGLGPGAGAGPPAAPRVSAPEAPRVVPAQPPAGRQSPPATVGSDVAMPAASYRVGYTDYLRSAGMSQVVALAGPGVAGILVLTGAGGLVGYRQARAGHAVRTTGSARFVN